MRPFLVAVRAYLFVALVVAGVLAAAVTVLFLAVAFPTRFLIRLGGHLGSLRQRSGAYRPTDAERSAGVFQPANPHARSLDSFQSSGARN